MLLPARSSFRCVLRRYKLNPNQDVKILALGGGTNRTAALKTGAIVRMVMKWAELDQPLAEGSCDMAASSCQTAVQPALQSIQVALDEIKTEEKLDVSPNPSKAFEWSFVQK